MNASTDGKPLFYDDNLQTGKVYWINNTGSTNAAKNW
jgi:hypothetical protein